MIALLMPAAGQLAELAGFDRQRILPLAPYPFFDVSRSRTEDYGILIVELDGKAVDPPVFYQELDRPYVQRGKGGSIFIERLGDAIAAGSPHWTESRDRFERNCLATSEAVRYRVVLRRWNTLPGADDPLKRKFEILKVLYEGTNGDRQGRS